MVGVIRVDHTRFDMRKSELDIAQSKRRNRDARSQVKKKISEAQPA